MQICQLFFFLWTEADRRTEPPGQDVPITGGLGLQRLNRAAQRREKKQGGPGRCSRAAGMQGGGRIQGRQGRWSADGPWAPTEQTQKEKTKGLDENDHETVD
jgi:hypothetical protein